MILISLIHFADITLVNDVISAYLNIVLRDEITRHLPFTDK